MQTRWLMVAFGVMVSVGWAARAAAQSPPCDPARYAELEDLPWDAPPAPAPTPYLGPDGTPLPQYEPVPMAQDFSTMAYFVSYTCVLPDALERALDDAWGAGPEGQEMAALRGLTSDFGILLGACGPETIQVVDNAARLPADDGQAWLIDHCSNLQALAAREDIIDLTIGQLLTAAATYGWLSSQSEPHAVELSRLLLGLGLTPRSSPPAP